MTRLLLNQDVNTLSYEIAVIYNDPVVAAVNLHDISPWWLAPNGLCLETGHAIELLPNEDEPIMMNRMTYHPQHEALLQWFESTGTSNVLRGALSYPDTSVLLTANISQQSFCTSPFH